MYTINVEPIDNFKPTRSPEELIVAQSMIDDGVALCESNSLDGHMATRIGKDGGFYCDDHDENNF